MLTTYYCAQTNGIIGIGIQHTVRKQMTSSIQWIPFLMFETLNSCRRKLVCAKIMPNVGKNLSWCALLPNFKKNRKRKFISSQIRFVYFPHLRGQLWGVTTSQYHSFLSTFDMSGCADGVQERIVRLSVQPSFPFSLAIGGRSTCVYR